MKCIQRFQLRYEIGSEPLLFDWNSGILETSCLVIIAASQPQEESRICIQFVYMQLPEAILNITVWNHRIAPYAHYILRVRFSFLFVYNLFIFFCIIKNSVSFSKKIHWQNRKYVTKEMLYGTVSRNVTSIHVFNYSKYMFLAVCMVYQYKCIFLIIICIYLFLFLFIMFTIPMR